MGVFQIKANETPPVPTFHKRLTRIRMFRSKIKNLLFQSVYYSHDWLPTQSSINEISHSTSINERSCLPVQGGIILVQLCSRWRSRINSYSAWLDSNALVKTVLQDSILYCILTIARLNLLNWFWRFMDITLRSGWFESSSNTPI